MFSFTLVFISFTVSFCLFIYYCMEDVTEAIVTKISAYFTITTHNFMKAVDRSSVSMNMCIHHIVYLVYSNKFI